MSCVGNELECYRYATEQEARRNHDYLVHLHSGSNEEGEKVIETAEIKYAAKGRKRVRTARYKNRVHGLIEEKND